MCADDLCDLEPPLLKAFEQRVKVVQRVAWRKAMAHATYLKAHPLGYMPWRPCALRMWLESWRLQRLEPALRAVGVDVKEDLLDLVRQQQARRVALLFLGGGGYVLHVPRRRRSGKEAPGCSSLRLRVLCKASDARPSFRLMRGRVAVATAAVLGTVAFPL
jgi:hypothetical protein